MTCVLFGISGSIAAFRGLEVIRMLTADGITVVPVISEGGINFVTVTSVEALAGRRPVTEIFPDHPQTEFEHIVLSKGADLIITCPASADIIAKYAHGIADDPLALVALTFGTPHLVVPAMNPRLWSNPATLANVEILKNRGFEFVGPVRGGVACGDEGWGRMSPVDEVYGRIKAALGRDSVLNGLKVLVSSGATREPIDDVRYITNRSSGKMGNALAAAARNMGAETTLVTASGNIIASQSAGVGIVRVETAGEMHEAIIERAGDSDVVIMAAAVSDFRPTEKLSGKVKKDKAPDSITLERTADILMELGGQKKKGQLLIGFAAEYGDSGKAEALRKCKEKNCDFICLNDISGSGGAFGSDENEVSVIYPDGSEVSVPRGAKSAVASEIMKMIAGRLDEIR